MGHLSKYLSVCLSTSASSRCLYPIPSNPSSCGCLTPLLPSTCWRHPSGPPDPPPLWVKVRMSERGWKKNNKKKKQPQLPCEPGHWVSPGLVKPNQGAIMAAIGNGASKAQQRLATPGQTEHRDPTEKKKSDFFFLLFFFWPGHWRLSRKCFEAKLKNRRTNRQWKTSCRQGDRHV